MGANFSCKCDDETNKEENALNIQDENKTPIKKELFAEV